MAFPRVFGRAHARAFALLFAACVGGLRAVPTVSQPPQSAAGIAGSPVSLSVVASGNGALTYQWRRDGFALANANTPTLTLPRPSQTDTGYYDVTVSDGQGSVTSTAALLRIAPIAYPDLMTPQIAPAALVEFVANGLLTRVVATSDGGYYAAGGFSSIRGQRRSGLARFLADGTLDSAFTPPLFDGPILDMALQTDGRLVVVGDFRSVNGASSVGIARINANGTVDASFRAGSGFVAPAFHSPTLVVLGPDGVIFVGGEFTTYQGQPSLRLAKLDAFGAIDRNFTPPRLESEPYSLAATPEGKLYCVGARYEQAGALRDNRVCRLLPNGSLDSTFDAGAGAQSGAPFRVFRQRDGRIVLTGSFGNFSGANTRAIARLNENGSLDSTFTLGFTSQTVSTNRIAQAANGDLYVSGSSLPSSLLRVKLDGTIDSTFRPPFFRATTDICVTANGRIVVAGPLTANTEIGEDQPDIALLDGTGARINADAVIRFPAAIKMMTLLSDGKILIGGAFSHWNGTPVACIVRVNPDLTLDPTFLAPRNPAHRLSAGAVQPDGKIIVAGPLAKNAPDTVRRLNADGSADATFQTSGAGIVRDRISVLPDGRIVVPDYDAQPRGLRVLAADGTPQTTHEFGGAAGTTPASTSITRLSNGQFLAAGGFATWAGQPKPKLARLNADGSVDASFSFTPGIVSRSLGFDSSGRPTQSSGRIILSASLQSVGSPLLLGLQPNGQADPTFLSALSSAASLNGHAIQADDRLLVWGRVSALFGDPLVTRLLPDGAADPSFSIVGEPAAAGRATLTWSHALTLDSGDLVAATEHGSVIRLVRVTTPIITAQPTPLAVRAGDSATFSASAAGAGTVSYQWYFNGAPIAGAASAALVLPVALSFNAGRYHVVATNADGSATSSPADLAVDTAPSGNARLTNLSVRTNVGSAPLTTGFAIADGAREVLIRGVGPGLVQFGVAPTASDPRLALFSNGTAIDQNDNWTGAADVSAAALNVGAFPLTRGSLDATLLRTLAGPHTVQLSSAVGSGITLTEVYDANPAGTAGGRLSNLSARYQVGTGADVLIAGFTIGGNGNKTLLVRGVGPGLAAFGVAGTLADPQIAVYAGTTLLAGNNDWGGGFSLLTAFLSVGAFPLASSSKDAALLISLPAGSYTVQLSGVGNTTGEGLIEIYEMP